MCSESGVCVWSPCCKDGSGVLSRELLLLWCWDINLHQLAVIVILCWMTTVALCKPWLMLKQRLQLVRAGLMRTKPATHSASQDIRSDWWFCDGGRVSEHLIRVPPPPHPARSRRRSPICFSAALQGNQDSDTLWERGRQKDLHTKPGRGIYLIGLQFEPECISTKV